MIKTKIRWSWATVIFVSLVPRTFGAAESKSDIANKIRTEVAGIIAGINAHGVDQATHFDSNDIVSMESGRPASHGILEERKGLSEAFHHAPTWQLSLIEETMDVANSGELAIYKSTYNSETVDNDVPMTQRANFIAEFRRNNTGEFKVVWSVVSWIEKSHNK
jgi:ketosteroid isomerase-like protein